MTPPDQENMEGEIDRLRKSLEAEFEEFVSLAAHYLREPLRDVAAYSQLMAETYTGRLDSDAVVFMDRIQAGAAKMQSLLSGMVDYWALGTGDRELSAMDMEGVLNQTLLSAAQQIEERSATVTHDPLPQVHGDFEILTKVMLHLVRNAIDYCDKPTPQVHISCRREDQEWVFSVRDNGPGVEPAFQQRIFGVFKRLHGKQHPGNGLGLAFCKKAIEWQDGRMWMESEHGVGSTFYFTAPPEE